jgi:SAM-dependent methyltransferase
MLTADSDESKGGRRLLKARWLRGLWHLGQPLVHTTGRNLIRLPGLYVQFLRERSRFMAMQGDAPFEELQPGLFDKTPQTQSGGGHYFYQDIWALTKLAELSPEVHHDVGSRYDGFVGQATAICRVVAFDIRPPNIQLPRFEFRQGSILDLPLDDASVHSLSCLHVAEHVGLGRFGDELDPDGTKKALRELSRVLARGGQLLFSMPIGRERVCFNAHRVWHPERPVELFPELRLVEFKAVDDDGEFRTEAAPADFAEATFACGLYRFIKA